MKIIILLIILIIILILHLSYSNFNEKFYNEIEISPNLSKQDIINLRKGQNIMTNMLREFDRICRKYDLKYWSIGGTLIGAIRHKGWIPWDGDIDVGMLEEDYNKLQKIIQKELPNDIEFSEPTDKPCSKLRSKKAKYIYTKWGNNWDTNKGLQIDIFVFKHDNNNIYGSSICGIPDIKKRTYIDIFPLKEIEFEDILVYVPNKYKQLSKDIWDDFPPPLPNINKRFPHEGRFEFVDP
jgi:phosphorylcholine metabolism protein LicD